MLTAHWTCLQILRPFDKYRDEHYEIYKQKCEEFQRKAANYKRENMKALSNHKPKLGIKAETTEKELRGPLDENNVIEQKESYIKTGSSSCLLININGNMNCMGSLTNNTGVIRKADRDIRPTLHNADDQKADRDKNPKKAYIVKNPKRRNGRISI
ncbi:hypothetical protein CBL_20708 [Carabus blaptoides fortunei]